jgi:hypothetical protein
MSVAYNDAGAKDGEASKTDVRRFSAILAVTQPGFSAAQTVWRRGRDSINAVTCKCR